MAIQVPAGFRLGGGFCGLKRNPTRQDLSLVVSDVPAVAAGVYTQNLVFAAPVALDRANAGKFRCRVNSGNANARAPAKGTSLTPARRRGWLRQPAALRPSKRWSCRRA
jgi:N-acetylglutamate synthase/N-acetylornithine aminotransferase